VVRGGALTHKHFQMMMKENFSSLPVLNKTITFCLGWDVSPPLDHVVPCKKLRDEGLHTFKGMLGFRMKVNGEAHFEFVHHNISTDDMNDGKMKYEIFGKVGLNDRMR
jgi:hypothetical protein